MRRGWMRRVREVYERDGYLKPAQIVKGIKYYSEESRGIVKAMKTMSGPKALQLARPTKWCIQGSCHPKREEAVRAGSRPTEDDRSPTRSKPIRISRALLEINEDLLESITAEMAANGYSESKPVVLGNVARAGGAGAHRRSHTDAQRRSRQGLKRFSL